jgi:hypothetical protein
MSHVQIRNTSIEKPVEGIGGDCAGGSVALIRGHIDEFRESVRAHDRVTGSESLVQAGLQRVVGGVAI